MHLTISTTGGFKKQQTKQRHTFSRPNSRLFLSVHFTPDGTSILFTTVRRPHHVGHTQQLAKQYDSLFFTDRGRLFIYSLVGQKKQQSTIEKE